MERLRLKSEMGIVISPVKLIIWKSGETLEDHFPNPKMNISERSRVADFEKLSARFRSAFCVTKEEVNCVLQLCIPGSFEMFWVVQDTRTRLTGLTKIRNQWVL